MKLYLGWKAIALYCALFLLVNTAANGILAAVFDWSAWGWQTNVYMLASWGLFICYLNRNFRM